MPNPPQKNRGYLFPNTNKTNPSQPDFRGKLTVNGEEFALSGWNRDKDTPEGKVVMISVEATPASELPTRQGGAAPAAAGAPASRAPAPAAAAGAADPDGAVFGDIFSQPLD